MHLRLLENHSPDSSALSNDRWMAPVPALFTVSAGIRPPSTIPCPDHRRFSPEYPRRTRKHRLKPSLLPAHGRQNRVTCRFPFSATTSRGGIAVCGATVDGAPLATGYSLPAFHAENSTTPTEKQLVGPRVAAPERPGVMHLKLIENHSHDSSALSNDRWMAPVSQTLATYSCPLWPVRRIFHIQTFAGRVVHALPATRWCSRQPAT